MKRFALLVVIGASLLALPSTTAAQSGATNCPGGVGASFGQICVHERTTGAGGELVLDNGPASCTYVNGWSTSPVPGYAGICIDAVSRGPSCSFDAHPNGQNTGGCFGIAGSPGGVNAVLNSAPVSAVTAMFICGNTNGENPLNTTRRGCFIP